MKQLAARGTRWDENVGVLESSYEVVSFGCSGRTSTFLSQLSVLESLVEYQYKGLLEWRQEMGCQPKFEQIANYFTMVITLGEICWETQIRASTKPSTCATCNHYKRFPSPGGAWRL